MNLYGVIQDFPFGRMGVWNDQTGALVRIDFLKNRFKDRTDAAYLEELTQDGNELHEDPGAVARVISQLNEYFAGERRDFDLKLNLIGTDFQKSVWEALTGIGYGTCTSYGQLAERLGKPKAMRAVGLANGRNPVPIVVPCHRVIGANGKMVGYGGGLELKTKLLVHEGYLLF